MSGTRILGGVRKAPPQLRTASYARVASQSRFGRTSAVTPGYENMREGPVLDNINFKLKIWEIKKELSGGELSMNLMVK